MKTIVKLTAILSLLLFVAGSVYAGKKDPVAVLFQVKGKVEYSKPGKKWRKARRNKFLFVGYKVRSMEKGTGKILIKSVNKNMILEPNTVIEITANDIKVLEGKVSATKSASPLVSGLVKKFSKSQTYTTVRRARAELDAVRSIAVSNEYPYLMWNNHLQGYTYTLTINDDVYEIPPSQEDTVMVKIKPFSGKTEFKIVASKAGAKDVELKQYKRKNHLISWIGEDQQQELDKIIAGLKQEYGEDTFMLGTYYEENDMWVAAMGQYKKYLADYPEEIEMTPYLFKVYNRLKLENTYKKELAIYKELEE
jgi:Magnetotaxis protein MtxA, C-terminal domain/Magnetotaxis protein MtxA, Immunoglobulin-like domain